MAYHDVSEIEKLSWMEKNNIKICEFPLNLKVAKEAINKNYIQYVDVQIY